MALNVRTGEAWHREMFRNSPHGLIFFDKFDFTIRECNAAFSDLLNYKPEDLLGKIFTSFLFGCGEQERFLCTIGQSSRMTGFETRFQTKEGNERRLTLSWHAVDDSTYGCFADVTGFNEMPENPAVNDFIHYRQLAEILPTGILVVTEGKIRYANPAFLSFSGLLPDDISEKDLLSLIDDPDGNIAGELTGNGWNGMQNADPREFRFITKSGSERTALLFAIHVMYSGKPAALINLVDISDKQLTEDKIQLDNERRRGIIVTVAHELRTPLQPILGYLNLLIQDPEGFGITEDTKKILDRCLVSVDRERQIINQMLELSVLDSGKLHLNYSKCQVFPLITSVLDSGGYNAKAEITVDVSENLVIAADMDRLFGVFDSLLSNAVNFSQPPRRITIFSDSASDDAYHRISFRDNGAGIAKNALLSIFEPFQLADASRLSRRFDRIGLSLAMAKKIMQMHGGEITVESVIGAGSTFTLHLPKRQKSDE